jgi:hypothetical protein
MVPEFNTCPQLEDQVAVSEDRVGRDWQEEQEEIHRVMPEKT